ncbi:MAG: hypothetical protein ACLFP1_06890 [Candidatus Goldiibacteriota bacterium]
MAFIDMIFIAGALLLIYERRIAAFVFFLAGYTVKDAYVMPFLGINLVSGMAAAAAIMVLAEALYTGNYITRVLILFLGYCVKLIIHTAAVWIFYAEFKYFMIPAEIFYSLLMTTVAGAAVLVFSGVNIKKGVLWLKMKYGKI